MSSSLRRQLFSPGRGHHHQNPVTPFQGDSSFHGGRSPERSPSRSRSRSRSRHSSTHGSATALPAQSRTRTRSVHQDLSALLVPINTLLFRPLEDLPAKLSGATPAINRAAEKRGFHLRTIKSVPYNSFNAGHPGLIEQEEFLRFLDSVHAPHVPYFPQTIRYLLREADVAGEYMSNCLNPAVAILQELLNPRYRGILKVVIESQYEAESEDRAEDASSYATNFQCEDFIFTDYINSVAVKINVEDVEDPQAKVDVGAEDCATLVDLVDQEHAKNPTLAVVWIGVVALDKLGLLRPEVRGEKESTRKDEVLRWIGEHRLITGQGTPAQRAATPEYSSRSSSSSGRDVSSISVDPVATRTF
ncbi:hypothetical protein JCM16303_003543 [Sporobolomyces ruberrimus]